MAPAQLHRSKQDEIGTLPEPPAYTDGEHALITVDNKKSNEVTSSQHVIEVPRHDNPDLAAKSMKSLLREQKQNIKAMKKRWKMQIKHALGKQGRPGSISSNSSKSSVESKHTSKKHIRAKFFQSTGK